MNLSKLWPSSLLCLAGHLLLPSMFPAIRFMAFAPLITLIISRYALAHTLWLAASVGLLLDLYTMGSPLGFFGVVYSITALIVYRYRKYFLEEKIFIFALYTTLFSFVCTLVHFILHALIVSPEPLRLLTIVTDILLMPILDGVYALAWVLFPLTAVKFFKKQYIVWQQSKESR